MSHHPRSAKRPVKPATIDRRDHKARERAQPRPVKPHRCLFTASKCHLTNFSHPSQKAMACEGKSVGLQNASPGSQTSIPLPTRPNIAPAVDAHDGMP